MSKSRQPRRAPARKPGGAPGTSGGARRPAGGTATATKGRATPSRPAARPATRRSAAGRIGLGSLTRADWAIVLLFALPAAIVPGGLDRFVFGKLLIAALGVGLAFTAPVTGRLSRAVSALLAAGAVLLALSALLSHAPEAALLGRAPLNEGALVLAVYLLAGVSGARLLGPGRSARSTRVAIATMAACALAVAFLAVLEAAGLRPLSSDLDRPGSLLGNASDEGAFAVLYLGPLLVDAVRGRRPLPALGAAAALLTVVLSGSRGALLGLVAALVVAGLLGSRATRWKVAGAALAAAALVLAIPFTRDRVFDLSPLAAHTVTGRQLLWRETLALIGDHPILGVGPSQFEVAIVAHHDLHWQKSIGPANPPGSPHDWLLQVLVDGGVLLLIVVLWLVVLLVREGIRRVRDGDHRWTPGVLAGLCAYGVALLFHFPSPGTLVPACVLAGGLLAVAPAAEPRRAEPWLRRGVPALAGALAVLFLLGSLAEIWLRLGNVAAARGQFHTADADYRTARVLRFWDVDLPGQVLHEFTAAATSGNKAALPYAQQWSRRLGPVADDEQLVQNRAALLDAAGDYPGAVRLLDAQLRIDPDNPNLLVLRGVVHVQQQQYPAAQHDLLAATRIDPGNADAWQDLSIVYRQQGKATLAARAAAEARRQSHG